MDKLTERQQQVLDCIRRHIEETGYPPTRADIARELGFKSANAAEEHLKALARKGAIEIIPGASRGIRLPESSGIPIVGRVAAGRPIEALSHDETLAVPEHLLGRGETFVLQVAGDSMIDEHIQDGDFLVVERRETARPGERVVALIDGESATLKTFHQETDGTVRLEPANPAHETQRYAAERVRIQGVAIGVLRKYR